MASPSVLQSRYDTRETNQPLRSTALQFSSEIDRVRVHILDLHPIHVVSILIFPPFISVDFDSLFFSNRSYIS